ncbi:cytochrome c4 [Ramlibacter ginsenosidimutans]|uniref:Cytochrome c4 n=1 Tax=Ramlibacter ginsenosidimutans TaxID=502333 RepID=A0A934TRY0_9BURK|nr:c-type cytochrome [Ramlibacter ginsenosidimutans]MBK6006387.1 cytochrome c4 [Ramlibacter ginsenosidimutans]
MHATRTALAFAALLAVCATAAAQDVEAGRTKAQACAACHGADGNGTTAMPEVPALAGQTWRYLYIQLKDFKEGRRSNPLMTPMAQPLSRDDMIDIANYYASLPLKPNDFKVDDGKAKLGKAKADETLCTMCHLGGFLGQNEIPRVAGQKYQYIVAQLKAFKEKTRTNDAGNMTSVASTLSDQDIENLGHYLASLR